MPRDGRRNSYSPFLDDYQEHCLDQSFLYPGIPELLKELTERKIPLGILTNKAEPLAKKMVRAFFSENLVENLVENLRGARPDVPLKPHPDSALALSADLGLDPREVIFVGDSRIDMETAVEAGMLPCGVRWGFRSEEELLAAGAKRILSHPRELLELIN